MNSQQIYLDLPATTPTLSKVTDSDARRVLDRLKKWQLPGDISTTVVCCDRVMNDRQYAELLGAILDLRGATEAGFNNVDRRFNELEERWDWRFSALERSVVDGFHAVDSRFSALEQRFDILEGRVGGLDGRVGSLERRVGDGFRHVSISLASIASRLSIVEQR